MAQIWLYVAQVWQHLAQVEQCMFGDVWHKLGSTWPSLAICGILLGPSLEKYDLSWEIVAPIRQHGTQVRQHLAHGWQYVADFPAVFFHISHWYLSWNRAREIHM